MATNNSSDWLYVSPTGQAITVAVGDSPPSGSTVLVCPGGTIPDELAERYKVTDRLKGDGAAGMPRDDAGNPLVVRAGKAYAASVLAEDDPARKAVEAAAQAEDEAAAAAQGKKGAKAKAAADEPIGQADEADADADDEDDKTDEADAASASAVKVKADAQGKAVRLGDPTVEDKSVSGPPQAKRGPTRPTPKGK